MSYPENLKYTKEHEWVLVENGNARGTLLMLKRPPVTWFSWNFLK